MWDWFTNHCTTERSYVQMLLLKKKYNTTPVWSKMFSSDYDSGVGYSLIQSTSVITYRYPRFCWFSVTSWDCLFRMQPLHIVLYCIHNFLATKCYFSVVRFELSDKMTHEYTEWKMEFLCSLCAKSVYKTSVMNC